MNILFSLLTITGTAAAFIGGVNWLANNPPKDYVEEYDQPGCHKCIMQKAFDPSFEQQCQATFDKYQKTVQEIAEQPAPNLCKRTLSQWHSFLTKIPLAYRNLRLHVLKLVEDIEDGARNFCRRSIAQQPVTVGSWRKAISNHYNNKLARLSPEQRQKLFSRAIYEPSSCGRHQRRTSAQ